MADQGEPGMTTETGTAIDGAGQAEKEIFNGARAKTMSEKGLGFIKDSRCKQLSGLFRKLKRKTEDIQNKMIDGEQNADKLRAEYTDWMLMYEELLSVHVEYCALLPETEKQNYLDDIYEDRDTYLKNFKAAYSNWQINIDSHKAKIQSASHAGTVISAKHSSLSHVSSHRSSRHTHVSLASAVSAARLKSEQDKAALEARMSVLKKKNDMELAKAKLKIEEEELNLATEMAIVNAKSKILDIYERQSEPIRDQANLPGNGKMSESMEGKTDHSNVNNVQSVLNVNSPCFIPGTVHDINGNTGCDGNINPNDVTGNDNGNGNGNVSHVQPVKSRYLNADSCHGINVPFTMQSHNTHEISGEPVASNQTSNDAILSVIRHLKKPTPEIKRFGGDLLEYRRFMRQFHTKVIAICDSDDEKMSFLEQFTVGDANRIVSGFSHLPAKYGFPAALDELELRYGDTQRIADAFIRRALDHPSVRPDDAKALDDLSILLIECQNAVKCIQAVRVLEYPENLRRLVGKLPYYLHDKWRTIVQNTAQRGEVIHFGQLVQFVRDEARKANDPIFGREAMNLHVFKQNTRSGSNQPSRPGGQYRSKGSFATSARESETVVVSSDKQPDGSRNMSTSAKPKDNRSRNCLYCNDAQHKLDSCNRFSTQLVSERNEFVKSKGLCYGCLKPGHQSKDCWNKLVCSICKLHHPTVLHDETRVRKSSHDTTATEVSHFAESVSCSTRAGEGRCTMAIVPVQVKLRNSIKAIKTYAFLDPGSSISFCSDSLAKQLGASGPRMAITLDTMGNPFTLNTEVVDGLQIYDLNFDNAVDLPKVYTKDCIPVSKDLIPTSEDISVWEHLSDIELPMVNAEVGLLIGNNVADAYTPIDIRTGPKRSPHAAKTVLGWVIWNLVREQRSTDETQPVFHVNRADILGSQELEKLDRLDKLVRHAINLDFPERISENERQPSQEDKKFLDVVSRSITQKDGHYSIGLPFKRDDIKLPDNRSQAFQRLKSLKHRLQRNPGLYRDYTDFMSQLLKRGYAEHVPEESLGRSDGRVWYIPHHGVYHPQKPDKIRVVFDCAATYSGVSLNSVLLQGPDLTNNLVGVLCRFRQDKIGIMGDIEAMFHQVRVTKKDCDCLRFFWWPNGDLEKKPEAYRMLVHLFGATSSPSCASYALRQTAKDYGEQFEERTVKTVERDFYVDDCLSAVSSEESGCRLIKDVSALCTKGGFHLTKWVSSSCEVLHSIPTEQRAKEFKELNLERESLPNERALGVYWFVETDTLGFRIKQQNRPTTRRGILSLVSSVYDPLGLAAPFLLRPKILMQDLCRRNIGWDETISSSDLDMWIKWLDELQGLQELRISRSYIPSGFGVATTRQIHIFADASDQGYGMVAYLRLMSADGIVACSFVTGKARVAPLKKMTIPRLELTAATAAVRLGQMLRKEFDFEVEMFYWTDSLTVLRYLSNETARFHTFVANRVAVIRDATSAHQWRYVNTKSNPADCASRGLCMSKFLQCKMWFGGPSFLSEPESKWPKPEVELSPVQESDAEVKQTCMTTLSKESTGMDRLLGYYSDWTKLKKAVAWFQRAASNLKLRVTAQKKVSTETHQQKREQSSHKAWIHKGLKDVKLTRLTVTDLREAERILVRYVQGQHFEEEIRLLTSQSRLKKSALRKLDPRLDDGILRVGGRLERADIPFNAKHPVLLPKDSCISKLILQDVHKSVGHMGKNAILSELRQQYWIPGAASLIKSMVSKCVTCRRYQGSVAQQKMASLPADRLKPDEPPFTKVGMDFFGPFELKRGRSIVKRYGVVFTCLTIRAVHLEVAHSLDTDSCINAIRRFVARRGTVKSILSDNGTNLVGANREMREEINKWNSQKINDAMLQKNIEWNFNPPAASHFGGVWERIIRLVRKVLYSLLKEQNNRLDDEALHTLLCEVEAILNARPITENPATPGDLDALTPNHLILQKSGEQFPPGLFHSCDNYARRRWRQVQHVANTFWKRWMQEYLPLLQQRQKWCQPKRNVTVGDVVLVVDSTPRNSWAMGRVMEVFKDKKGLVRSVKLKTKSCILSRPVSKLCLLLEGDS